MTGPAEQHKKGEGAEAKEAAASANPFLHSAAAFAAAAVAGLDFQRQLANTMLGFFETALRGAKGEDKAKSDDKAKTESAPVAVKPVVVPVAAVVVAASEPVAAPVKVAKVSTVKAKPKVMVAKVPAVKPAAAKAPARRAAEAPAPVVAASSAPARKTRAAKDDLKQISGVGPKLEQVLKGKGISRFADIAAWSDADVARIDAELGFDGRIGRDDWVGQAKALSGGRKARK